MTNWKLSTPVVFTIFNQPHRTNKVFEVIRSVKPSKLLVIADGPRSSHRGEAELCAQTRAVTERVDWDCEVLRNYSDINLGLKKRLGMTGLPWVFDLVEEAIILEDDCLPDPTFFRFCQELLDRYRYDEQVFSICGTNPLLEWKSNSQSYHFSYSFSCWGWASWKRSWNLYDVQMKLWKEQHNREIIKDFISNDKIFNSLSEKFDNTLEGKINSWAYQMVFSSLLSSSFVVVPSKNLISNIGFSSEATNTRSGNDPRALLPTYPMLFPLKLSQSKTIDRNYERKRYFKIEDRSLFAKIYRIYLNLINH